MEMSVTRGLAELKRLDDKIKNSYHQDFIGITIGRNQKKRYIQPKFSVDAAITELTSNLQSVTDTIQRRSMIKSAIVKSNAITTVTIGDKLMTVAEAIELKQSVVYKQELLQSMLQQMYLNEDKVTKGNNSLQDVIDKSIEVVYGKESKIEKDDYDKISNSKLEAGEYNLLDPNNLHTYVKQLTEEISVINNQLDYILSESNARTSIFVY